MPPLILARGRPLPGPAYYPIYFCNGPSSEFRTAPTVFCEVEMNCEFVLPEFDPQLHPIGYALARAMPDESTVDAVVERRRATPSPQVRDRFGWEYNTAA